MSDGELIANLLAAYKEFGNDEVSLPFAAAFAIMRTYTSEAFHEAHLYRGASPDAFLGTGGVEITPQFHWRFPMLAEFLFQLRSAEGFDVLLERLDDRPLRPTFFEARSAAMMRNSGFDIIIRRESGVKGKDFDFIATKDGITINCEVTAFTAPQLAESTIRNGLAQKRRQLPDDAPALIFATIPEEWLGNGPPTDELDAVASAFLRATRRINAVVFVWDAFTQLETGEYAYASLVRPTLNTESRLQVDLDFLHAEHPGSAWLKQYLINQGEPLPNHLKSGRTLSYMDFLASLSN